MDEIKTLLRKNEAQIKSLYHRLEKINQEIRNNEKLVEAFLKLKDEEHDKLIVERTAIVEMIEPLQTCYSELMARVGDISEPEKPDLLERSLVGALKGIASVGKLFKGKPVRQDDVQKPVVEEPVKA